MTHSLSSYKEELEINKAKLNIAYMREHQDYLDFKACVVGEDVRNYIPSLTDDHVGKIVIFDGKIVYTAEELTDAEKEVAETLKVETMSLEDYQYMLGLTYLSEAVIAHAEDETKIGTALGTEANPSETVAGINYGLGWYKISTEDELNLLFSGDEDAEEKISYLYKNKGAADEVFYGAFIVKYSTGAVQSIPGKQMYAGTDHVIHKYTFNYAGEEGGVVVENLLSGVTSTSTKTDTTWGNFENYNDTFEYETDENENVALVLDGGVNANMQIDQTMDIGKAYTVSVTVKGTTNQPGVAEGVSASAYPDGIPRRQRTILAMSDQSNKYVCWLGIIENNLRIYNFRYIYSQESFAKNPNGFGWVEVSEYDNEYMNIQIASEREGMTKVYINGVMKASYNSGDEVFTYNNLTIGDLRNGRGLRYIGNIYNVAIYGSVLSEEQIYQNWEAIKDVLDI